METIYSFVLTKTPINLVLHLEGRTKPGNFFFCPYFARNFSKLFFSNFTKVGDAVFKISCKIRNKGSKRRVANGTESNGKKSVFAENRNYETKCGALLIT